MNNRAMQFSLRTMLLVTTMVAIATYTFMLGTGEAVVTLFFFACLFGPRTKRLRWLASVMLASGLIGYAIYESHSVQADLGLPRDGNTACVDILFTGRDHTQFEEVCTLLGYKILPTPAVGGISSLLPHWPVIPFFRIGFIKLSFDKEHLTKVEGEVRRKIGEAFPNLKVTIKGHSI